MQATQLAEVGSWIVVQAPNLIFGKNQQPLLVASQYWTSSKVRLQRWITALKMFESDIREPTAEYDPWPAFEIVVHEIIVSELLTRVWSATVLMHDQYHQTDELHGLAHSVHISHLEAKNRAFRILLAGQTANEPAFDRINRLRRRIERWTDMFLGQLPHGEQASGFGFDRQRILDFQREHRESDGESLEMRQKVLLASFSADLIRSDISYAANPTLNREIAGSILACFPSDRFDRDGLPKSLQQVWLEKAQHETQMLVDQLMLIENAAEGIN